MAASTAPPTCRATPWPAPSSGSLCEAAVRGDGGRAAPRTAPAACMEAFAMTKMASVCAPLASRAPAASRPAGRAGSGKAASSSVRARPAAADSPSASRTPMAAPVGLAGGATSAKKPVPLAGLGPPVTCSVDARTEAPVTALVAVSVPQDGTGSTAKNQTETQKS